ncbi:MAG: hypothetical protein J5685_00775 [Clostridiales bacterium]|nr:hypothetical protein [Clostridiales bacterium]
MKKMRTIHVISAFLAAAVAAPLFCSCSSSKRTEEVISSSDPWYECEITDITEYYPKEEYSYVDYEMIGVMDDSVYVKVDSTRGTEGEESFIYEQDICRFSFNGELTDRQVITSIGSDDVNAEYRYLVKAWLSDGIINLWESDVDETTGEETYYLNGEMFEIPDLSTVFGYITEAKWSLEDLISSNGYILINAVNKYGISDLVILSPDGSVAVPDLSQHFSGGYSYIGEFMSASSGKVVFDVCVNSGYEIVTVSLDLQTQEITELMSQTDMGYYYLEYAGDHVVRRGFDGLFMIDPQTSDASKICTFYEVDAPFVDLIDTRTVYVSDDGSDIVLFGEIASNRLSYSHTGYSLMHLTRAESNPHAGKKVLIASHAEDDYPDYHDGRAIQIFNNTNDSYFIRYVFNMDENGAYVDPGADIVFDYDPEFKPSDEAEWLDLTPFLDNDPGFDESEYFSSAIEASRINGGLYRMPLDIKVKGIVTASVNVPAGQNGFTFDQYEEFVENVCNGIDPLSSTPRFQMGKAEYFTTLFTNMSDLFITDGRVDLSGEDFRSLLEFVDENGSAETMSDEDIMEAHNAQIEAAIEAMNSHNASISGTYGAVYGNFYSFSNYLNCYVTYGEGLGVYGIPSFDGRGPQATSGEFVSISADTLHPEECAEFVKILLSYEVQSSMIYGNPINRQAMYDMATAYIDEYNSMDEEARENAFFMSGGTELPSQIPSEAVERYMDLMSSSYGGMNIGIEIEAVLREESSAYFSGQRAPDDIIPVMQDRIQTILDER